MDETPQITTTTDNTRLYVIAVISVSISSIMAVTLIIMSRPTQDNTAYITIILGFALPLVTGLLAAAVRQVAMSVDGRLTQLLQLTAKSSRAEGKLEGNNK